MSLQNNSNGMSETTINPQTQTQAPQPQQPIKQTMEIQSKQDLLMCSLKQFFSVPENLGKMIPILTQKSKISLRLLDWFVTNFAKKKNIGYFVKLTKSGKEREIYFNVYLNYKSQLKAYSKQQFDPFCRKWKIMKRKKSYCGIHFYYKKDQYVETTSGQLNFFRWVIANKVLDYAIEKITDIQKDMLMFAKKRTTNSKGEKEDEIIVDESEDQLDTNDTVKDVSVVQPATDYKQVIANSVKVKDNVCMDDTDKLATDATKEQQQQVSINASKKLTKKHISITVDFN